MSGFLGGVLSIQWKSMVTNILQNIFCALQKKESLLKLWETDWNVSIVISIKLCDWIILSELVNWIQSEFS